MKKFKKYTENLRYDNEFVYSYNTKVGKIWGINLLKLEWNVKGKTFSRTTTRHLNYAATELGLELA